jgi:hypothetical protein
MHLKRADFDLDAPLALPGSGNLILAVNASLATRVHSANASNAVDPSEWTAEADHWYRAHRQDRGPSTPADRVTCVQFLSSVGIVTAFLGGCDAPSSPLRDFLTHPHSHSCTLTPFHTHTLTRSVS